LRIIAAETDSDVKFSSPDIIFCTPREIQLEKEKTEFKDYEGTAKRCKILLRIKKAFKRAIIYNNN
jgi:hypothetical protein